MCSAFFLVQILFAQSKAILKGSIRDAKTGKAIPFASVSIQNQKEKTFSNQYGEYELILEKAKSKLVVSSFGYQLFDKELVLSGDNICDISLLPSKIQLSTVVLSAAKKKEVGVQSIANINLKLRPIQSAQDLLKTIPGLFIAQHAGGGKSEQIFLRGFDNDHGTDFAISVDEIPVNLSSHAHGQGYADLHFLIPEIIEDADYYKGPHEASIGNFAVSGAASYTTKKEIHKNIVRLEYGQYNFARALGVFDVLRTKNLFSKKKETAYIAVEGTFNEGFFKSKQNLKRINTFSKYTGEFGQNYFLAASVSTFNSTWNASGQIPLRAVQSGLISRFGAIDDSEGGSTERVHVNLELNKKEEDKKEWKHQLYYVYNNYDLYSNFSFFQNNPVDGDMIHQAENRNSLGYNSKFLQSFNIANFKNKLEIGAGVQYTHHDVKLDNNKQRAFTGNVNKFVNREMNANLYLKDLIHLSSKVSILAGLRTDFFTFDVDEIQPIVSRKKTNAIRFSPKFSLFYDITKNMQLYAKASSGFHSNYAQSAVNDREIHPLPRAIGYDLGSEFKIGNNLLVNTALWYSKSDAEYVFVADGFEFENKGRSQRYGVDASLRYQPWNFLWVDTDINYSYGTLLDEPSNANKIPSAPRFTNTGGITLQSGKGFSGAINYRYLGERPLIEDESVVAEDYFVLDATLKYKKKNYEIAFFVENVLDTQWVEAVFYDTSRLQGEATEVEDFHFTPGTPFSAKLGVTYYFD